nr:nucleolar and coiled-body phosphoprotein 1-like [Aegilops tauschii subsp. strangulata]
MIGADFLRRGIAPLQNKGRPAWEYRNAADIIRLRSGLNNNLMVMQHAALCQKLFHLKADKTDKADKPLRLPAGVIPLCNNSAQTTIIAMMPVFKAHGLDQNWAEPDAERVQEFFNNLSERAFWEETQLIRPTTDKEVAYIASRVEEVALAEEAGIVGFVEDKASAEEDFAERGKPAGEHSGAATGGPFAEGTAEETAEEAAEEQSHEEPPVRGKKKHVLRRVGPVEPVRQASSHEEVPVKGAAGKAAQRQEVQPQPVRQMRRTTAAAKEAAAAAAASAMAKRPRSPSPPLCTDTANFDLSSFSPRREKRPEEEDEDMETLAQRMAKKAKTSTGDEPLASTSSAPETIIINPESSATTLPPTQPLARRTAIGGATEGHPRHASSVNHTAQGGSLSRASTDEPTRVEEEPVSTGAGGSITAMNVAGEGVTSQALATDLPLADQMDVNATIKETAKDAAAEAAANEAAKDAHEEATKGSDGEAGKDTDDRTDGIPAARAPGAATVPEPPVAGETVVEDQPSTSEAPPQADT